MAIQMLKFLEVTLSVDPYFGLSSSQKVKLAVAQESVFFHASTHDTSVCCHSSSHMLEKKYYSRFKNESSQIKYLYL